MQSLIVDDHGGTPWEQAIYQTEQLTDFNGRAPEEVLARQVSAALDDLGIDNVVYYDLSPFDSPSEMGVCSYASSVSVPGGEFTDSGEVVGDPPADGWPSQVSEHALPYFKDYLDSGNAPVVAEDSNILLTDANGGGCAGVGANYAAVGMSEVDSDPGNVVRSDSSPWGFNVTSAMHEIGHNMGFTHEETAGMGWHESDGYHLTPNGPHASSTPHYNLCGEYQEFRDGANVQVDELYYWDCVASHIQIKPKDPLNEPEPDPDPVEAQFNMNTDGLKVTTDGRPSSGGGGIVEYHWDWGDGTQSFSDTASHFYNSGGTYTITLTVTGENGESDSTQRTASVTEPEPEPEPDPDPDPLTAAFDVTVSNLHVLVDGRPSSGGGGIAEYRWSWGDGTQSTGATAAHDYDEPGDYRISLLVTGSNGGTASAQDTITATSQSDDENGNGNGGGIDRGTGVVLAGGVVLAFLIARPERPE